MKLQLKYFANLADEFGIDQEVLELSDGKQTVGSLKKYLSERGPQWQQALAETSTKCAVNQMIVNDTERLTEGAEVAFFPPVTGG